MPRKTKVDRVRADMKRLGIFRDVCVMFGRPLVQGIPIHVIAERYAAGETRRALALDYEFSTANGLNTRHVENAIRFVLLYPKSDLPSFWRDL